MLLGLDLGTTNIKALLVEESGEVLARASAPVKLIHVGDTGVEQDIEEIWSAALAAIRTLGQSHNLASVQAIGVSSQGGALQLLDPNGAPAERVISWLDGCGEPCNEALTRELGSGWFAEHIGHGRSALAIGQILRLRKLYPKLFAKPIQVGFVGDVIVSGLCGRRAHDATSLSIAMLYNPRLRRADPDLLARLGLAEEQLPVLLSPRAIAGGLLESVARSTGLPAGTPVSPAVHDQYASTLGAGAVAAGDLMLGTGTAWVLLAATAELVEPVVDAAFVCTHVVDGLYGQMLSLGNGGSSVTMALKLTGQSSRSDQIDEILEEAPTGSDGLRYWPFLVPYGGAGLAPGTSARLLNLRLGHTPAHIIRAVVEGLALEVRRYLDFLFSAHVVARRIVLCGAAAASRVTPQILANATGLPIDCVSESDTSALGAAVLARGLIAPQAGLAELSASMRQDYTPFEPDRDAGLYRAMLSEYLASLPRTA